MTSSHEQVTGLVLGVLVPLLGQADPNTVLRVSSWPQSSTGDDPVLQEWPSQFVATPTHAHTRHVDQDSIPCRSRRRPPESVARFHVRFAGPIRHDRETRPNSLRLE